MRALTRIPPYVALAPVLAGVFIAADDQTVVVTILPQIMLDMEVQVTELDRAAWTITGYLLGYVAAMPLIGRVSDVWGHRRIFAWALVAFMIGSAAVALAPTLGWLVAFRVFQAVGAGALVPISIAIVGDLFPSGRRGVPLGLVGASAEGGGVIGPLWGGLIVRFLDWPWVFWINIPLAAAVLAFLLLLLRPSPRFQASVDYVGGAFITLALAALTLGLARAGDPDGPMTIYLALSIAFLVLFALRQRSASGPLFPPSMFRGWTFRAANATHLLVGGGLIIGMVTIPLMANTVSGLAPLDGGLRLMRLTAAIPLGALLGGFACQRMDYRIPTALGLVLAGLGFLLMSSWDADVADPGMTVHLAVAGLGFGLVIAPIALAAINSVSEADRGAAAGLITAMRMVGMTLGLAALTAWGADRFQGMVAGLRLPLQLPNETAAQTQQRIAEFEAELSGAGVSLFQDFFLVAMGVCLIALVSAAMMAWRGRNAPPPPPTGEDLNSPPAGGGKPTSSPSG